MVWKLEILKQGADLRRRAEAQVLDVNEAHLMVHGVMARAFRAGAGDAGNVDQALTRAFERRLAAEIV